MRKIFSAIVVVLIANLCYSQQKLPQFTIYSRTNGVGHYNLEFFSDSSFIGSGSCGLATSILDKGKFEKRNDTIFLTLTEPRIINNIDTFFNPGHYNYRSDTLYKVDSLSFCDKKVCKNIDYKVLEERYPNGNLRNVYSWKTKQGVLNNVFCWDIFYAQGNWKEYFPNGQLKREIEYQDGLKNGFQLNYNEAGKLFRIEIYKKGKLARTKYLK